LIQKSLSGLSDSIWQHENLKKIKRNLPSQFIMCSNNWINGQIWGSLPVPWRRTQHIPLIQW
jgi:hypothetical protein